MITQFYDCADGRRFAIKERTEEEAKRVLEEIFGVHLYDTNPEPEGHYIEVKRSRGKLVITE